MASVILEKELNCTAEKAWSLLADFTAPHKAFVGLLVDAKPEEGGRVVTFASGAVIHEKLVTLDPERRRVVYSAYGGRFTHHSAAIEIVETVKGCRFVWIIDLLPGEAEPIVRGLMEQGAEAFAKTAHT